VVHPCVFTGRPLGCWVYGCKYIPVKAQGDRLDCTVSRDEPGVQQHCVVCVCVCMRDVGVHRLRCGLVCKSAHLSLPHTCPQRGWREAMALVGFLGICRRDEGKTHTHARTHACRHTHAHTLAEKHIAHAHAQTHTQAHTHTHTHTRMHTHTNTRAHAQTHLLPASEASGPGTHTSKILLFEICSD